MCKIMAVSGIKKNKHTQVQKLMKAMAVLMSKHDEDGVGYAGITKEGKIYGEKWLHKEDAFVANKSRDVDTKASEMMELFNEAGEFEKAPEMATTYESFGGKNSKKETVAYIMHARKATTGAKTINNTHPFVVLNDKNDPDTALIHNGGIVNHEDLTKKSSECDSEVILHEYLDHAMYHNPSAITDIAKRLAGQYAVGVLSSMWDNNTLIPVMDIFKSNKPLYAAYVKDLETVVFCTDDTMLKKGVEECGMKIGSMMKIKDGFLLRFNAITGKRMEDLIKFDLSWQHMKPDLKQINKKYEDWTPYKDEKEEEEEEKETIEVTKKNFESKHPTVFDSPYYDPDKGWSEEELQYLKALDSSSNRKAVRLVQLLLHGKVG